MTTRRRVHVWQDALQLCTESTMTQLRDDPTSAARFLSSGGCAHSWGRSRSPAKLENIDVSIQSRRIEGNGREGRERGGERVEGIQQDTLQPTTETWSTYSHRLISAPSPGLGPYPSTPGPIPDTLHFPYGLGSGAHEVEGGYTDNR